MTSRLLDLHVEEGVGCLEFRRPPVNALDHGMLVTLDDTLADLETRDDLRALWICGSGACFSAGLDLKAVEALDEAGRRDLVLQLDRALHRLYGFPRPVVAAVDGHAIAGGLVLALAADQRIVQRDARLGLAEVRVGIPFPVGAGAIVERELGPQALRLQAQLGYEVTPEVALERGMVDELAADEAAVRRRAQEVARELAAIPPHAYAAIKRDLRRNALQRIAAVLASGDDPALAAWDAAESREAARRRLRR